MKPLLEIRDLIFGASLQKVLGGPLNFSIHSGQLIWIHGPNGSGKSTLLKVLLGEKNFLLSGQMIKQDKLTYAYLPQLENQTVPWPLTLKDVIDLAGEVSPDLIASLLKPEQMKLAWNTASGGERKKALLLRVLAKKSDLLFLDEPFNHIDKTSLIDLVQSLKNYLELGGSIVMVDHKGIPESMSHRVSQEVILGSVVEEEWHD